MTTIIDADRRGRRLGTIYLAEMPEEYQKQLTKSPTKLLEAILKERPGVSPRLVYVTDARQSRPSYRKKVLRKMTYPCDPGKRLE